jgi:hypothetical protein
MAKTLANTDFYQKTFGHDEPQSVMKKKKHFRRPWSGFINSGLKKKNLESFKILG